MSAKLLVFVALLAVAVGVSVTVKDGAIVSEKNREVARGDALIDSLRVEKRKLNERIKEVGQEMAALPDSIRQYRTGLAMKEAQRIAKQEEIYENRITRTRKIKKSRAAERDAALRRIFIWDGALMGGVLLLCGVYFLGKRRG